MSLILGIESSCDETAVAVVKDGREVVGNAVATQIAKHAAHGGVVPELAAREHLKALDVVFEEALAQAGCSENALDAVAVTQGPGLIPALLVGVNFAKGLAINLRRPIIGVNHFIAHIYGAFLEDNSPLANPAGYPMLALVVSGGHTSLLLIGSDGKARHLGCTIDDAAGEALDKAAKLLNLGYPGGPAIQKAAEGGDGKRFNFPRPLTGTAGKALPEEHKFNFSFSGIKTALLYHVERLTENGKKPLEGTLLRDTAASYQEAVVDVLVKKTLLAVKTFSPKLVVAAGGVACNELLRQRLAAALPGAVKLQLAPKKYCTDNAAMVAGLGWHYYRKGLFSELDFDAFARLPQISEVVFTE